MANNKFYTVILLPVYTVSTKKTAPKHVLKSSKLASFVQLHFNSMHNYLSIFNKIANFSEIPPYRHWNIDI